MKWKRHAVNVLALTLIAGMGYLAVLMAVAAFPGWLVYFLNEGALYPEPPSNQFMFDTIWRTLLFWILVLGMYSVERGRRRYTPE